MTGQYVKGKLEAAGVPLATLARNLGISPQSLQKRLNVEDMKVGVLMEIAEAAGKNVYFFLEPSSAAIQQQTSVKGTSRNAQAIIKQTNLPATPVDNAKSEADLADCQQRLQEKDQIIADLRRTILLYEELSKKLG
ncbi:hypothetical protein [Fibrella forsythiae]|uniref:XRE family transcriptional regulator n=1 Tax=Fibrella forsythiae TaxID=2817061 RepID=A0ABS3JVM9_9BACT|nr:hypothetical protein [Fibrella forsythiae]MBO0953234.1 hypothetical protein [Fibrella forsythiae]